MTWKDLLALRYQDARRATSRLFSDTLREGKAFERVRLYEAAITAVRRWVRPQADVALDNARDYECAARDVRLAAEREVQCVVCTLVQDYHAALDALATIGAGHESDPTETANRALDGAAARMARFDDTVLPPAPTHVTLTATDNGTVTTEFNRNDTLYQIGKQLVFDFPDTWARRVREHNAQFETPLPDFEVEKILYAVARHTDAGAGT